ncbi:MAG: hypothetical protein HN352_14945 [Bacteroidetes bacterium]|jgi:hypothetical protein|nr:hypothetical protein [Bacteroidota bacterium]MBT4408798.1 hypothetical protein [Bacteroidota bacterium]MBT7093856.1 hypothetical protein [Bacteroidota bacterium]MBT7464720.1 hypothetical protein [Bacteroidota bacterium]
MKKLIHISLFLFSGLIIHSCNTPLPEFNTQLTMGNVDPDNYIINTFDPAIRLASSITIGQEEDITEAEIAELDVDLDGEDDFIFGLYFSLETNFEYEMYQDYYYEIRTNILLEIENEGIALNIEESTDTIYKCEWESGDKREYEVIRYTSDLGHQCPDNYSQSIEEVITRTFLKTYGDSDVIVTDSEWTSENSSLFRHEYEANYEDYNGSSHKNPTSIKNIRLGLLSWNEPQYIAFSFTKENVTKYGYLKFSLEEKDDYSWYLNILETVLEK